MARRVLFSDEGRTKGLWFQSLGGAYRFGLQFAPNDAWELTLACRGFGLFRPAHIGLHRPLYAPYTLEEWRVGPCGLRRIRPLGSGGVKLTAGDILFVLALIALYIVLLFLVPGPAV